MQAWGGLDLLYSQEQKNPSSGRRNIWRYQQSCLKHALTCTECLQLNVSEVTLRPLFIAALLERLLSPFFIQCIYVTEVVKQKCREEVPTLTSDLSEAYIQMLSQ